MHQLQNPNSDTVSSITDRFIKQFVRPIQKLSRSQRSSNSENTSVRVLVVCRSRREREEGKFCSGKVRAASIVIVFLLVCRSIREHVFLIVCHSRCVREKAFEDSAPGRCGVSSDRNECVFFRKVMWSNKFLSQFSSSLFFFFFDKLWAGGVLWWRVSRRHVPASKLNMLAKCSRSAIQAFFLIFNTCTMPSALWYFVFFLIFKH